MTRGLALGLILSLASFAPVQWVGTAEAQETATPGHSISLEATAYTLVPGDTVGVSHQGTTAPILTQVDLDGQIRLPEIGSVVAAGRSLDELEAAIVSAIVASDLYLDPRVSLSMESYAPVVVAGDVKYPGQFDYLPGMTVTTAIALSGGANFAGTDSYEFENARVELDSRLRAVNLEIAATAVRIARLEATSSSFLGAVHSGQDALPRADVLEANLVLPAELEGRIPNPEPALIDALVQAEAAVLANDLARTAELLNLWATEIGQLESQKALLQSRMELQRQMLVGATEALASAEALQTRGLQTGAQLLRAQDRQNDAQSDLLEMQSAEIAIDRSLSEARRQRSQLLSNRAQEALLGIAEERVTLADAELLYDRSARHQAILMGEGGIVSATEAYRTEFIIQRASSGMIAGSASGADSRILPGDTLIVQLVVASIPEGG